MIKNMIHINIIFESIITVNTDSAHKTTITLFSTRIFFGYKVI